MEIRCFGVKKSVAHSQTSLFQLYQTIKQEPYDSYFALELEEPQGKNRTLSIITILLHFYASHTVLWGKLQELRPVTVTPVMSRSSKEAALSLAFQGLTPKDRGRVAAARAEDPVLGSWNLPALHDHLFIPLEQNLKDGKLKIEGKEGQEQEQTRKEK